MNRNSRLGRSCGFIPCNESCQQSLRFVAKCGPQALEKGSQLASVVAATSVGLSLVL